MVAVACIDRLAVTDRFSTERAAPWDLRGWAIEGCTPRAAHRGVSLPGVIVHAAGRSTAFTSFIPAGRRSVRRSRRGTVLDATAIVGIDRARRGRAAPRPCAEGR